MPDEAKVEPEDSQPASVDPLSTTQRLIAGFAGAGSLGAGGASVFMTANQAGSVALLGVGAIFLTVAINGAPLLGAKFKDYELTMAPRRKNVVALAKLEEPEQAIRTLDVLEQIDPGSRRDPVVIKAHAEIYEREVRIAIRRLIAGSGTNVITTRFSVGGKDLGYDFAFDLPEKTLHVDVRYSNRDVPVSFPLMYGRKLHEKVAELGISPLLVVTNMVPRPDWRYWPESKDPKEAIDESQLDLVRWRDQRDDQKLANALNRLGVSATASP